MGGGGVYGGRGCRQLKCVRVGRREQQMTRCSPSTSWKTSVGTEDDRADEERIFRSKNKIIFMFRVCLYPEERPILFLFSCHIISSVYLFVIWHYHKIRFTLDVLADYWCMMRNMSIFFFGSEYKIQISLSRASGWFWSLC